MIEAKVILDSVSPAGKRITTLQLKYPRWVHGEFLTHRAFSRNSMSSRAVPVAKMIEQVRNDPAMPVHWGQNQPGMQARDELTGEALINAQMTWRSAAAKAADSAELMMGYGLAKQVANRILEPFQWMHTVVTATEWDNFFALRCHPDAQPEMQVLAFAMRGAMDASAPGFTEHHFPYVREEDGVMSMWRRAMISAARCARVSYLKHDGTAPSIGEDLALFERLAGGTPIHASPLEHQGVAMEHPRRRSRNFVGWRQFRELFEERSMA